MREGGEDDFTKSFKIYIFIFIFGCTGSAVLHGLSLAALVAVRRATLWLPWAVASLAVEHGL